MKTTNQFQKKSHNPNLISKRLGKGKNMNHEIYRMMHFLNLIKDESMYQPNIPIVATGDLPGKN